MAFLSLGELAAQAGTARPCASNLPIIMDDPERVWIVDQGTVDLFLIEHKEGTEQAAPQHLLRATRGRLIPGMASNEDDTTLRLLAKGLPGTILRRLRISDLARVDPEELAKQADAWVTGVTNALCRFAPHRPRPTALAEPGVSETYLPGTLSVRRGVKWVAVPPKGTSLFLDLIDTAELASASDRYEPVVPLTPKAWLSLFDEVALFTKSSATLAREGALLPALSSFHKAAFVLERVNRRLAVVDQANLERARVRQRRGDESSARHELLNVYGRSTDQSDMSGDPLLDALKIIGQREGIQFKVPSRSESSDSTLRLVDVLEASGVRARRVILNPDEKWWRAESTAVLAFRTEDEHPVALLPTIFGGYKQIDPAAKRSSRVSPEIAKSLAKHAWMFYPPLPSATAKPADLLAMGMRGSGATLVRLVLSGLTAGLLKLVPALALGLVANHIVAGESLGALYAVMVALAGAGLLGALLHLLQSKSMMRLEGQTFSRVEAAYWDRLMRLPPSVLHRYPAGSLAMSGTGFQSLREGFQGLVAESVLSFLFLLPIFAVIIFYESTLGIIALLFSLASLAIAVRLGLRQMPLHGKLINVVRQVIDQLTQIMRGITKLRVEHAEGSAFATWARNFSKQKRMELQVARLEGHMQAFGAALPFIAGAVLLVAVATLSERNMPVGDFLVVYALFIAFQAAIARLGDTIGVVAAGMSAFDHMRPLLAATVETEADGEPVEYLGGEILLDHLSFRYDADGPLILDDVTIHAHPGEFVAIAGESGAGKSTLFRLALGLDEPTTGAVYYDGRDIQHLNLKQLRRHIGTVPQSVQLHTQDIWDNIAAHHQQASSDDVWQAAELSGIKQEVQAMPMGMMTPVDTGSSVLSGGESQRVTIARALVRNPRVLLLDEATNWLDNENQAKVMQNLAALTATRIVIAHRLSTLQQADRIYVLQAGKIVQCGSFRELMEVEGVFSDLVRRQVA